MPKHITLLEVGPRDGFQNEPRFIATQDKIKFIQMLSETGLKHIEATSFVSPKNIPQLQDATAVLKALPKQNNVSYPVLIPNLHGLHQALSAGAKSITIFTASSESFNQHNINCSIQESIQRFKPVIELAKKENLHIRAYISCALGCPYEGSVEPKQVANVCHQLLKLQVNEIALADTIGVGTSKQTKLLLNTIMPLLTNTALAMHFHDTYGQALANILTSLDLGVDRFDASVAGLGGCPYAPGATGNVATEDVLYFLHGMGVDTGIDIYKMIQVGDWICKKLGKTNQSKVANAMLAQFKKQ